MKVAILAVLACMMIMAQANVISEKLGDTNEHNVEVYDFHPVFKYSSCASGIGDLINQAVVAYGDIYGTSGIHTAFATVYDIVFVRFPALKAACASGWA
mmetsp:Transcript_42043/g.76320  ORF Transcript_42043/g.76320 Transcript_42043/m.76320 type:complete len:99 (+) Transcript_42043:1-297(+)